MERRAEAGATLGELIKDAMTGRTKMPAIRTHPSGN
jgi:hypothetical protein